jgi:hypothetical protein
VRELGRRAGLGATSIQNYADGITLPNRENREVLAALMGLSLDELDIQIGLIDSIRPDRTVAEICRDIRLLSRDEFAIVLQAVAERAVKEVTRSDEPSQ